MQVSWRYGSSRQFSSIHMTTVRVALQWGTVALDRPGTAEAWSKGPTK